MARRLFFIDLIKSLAVIGVITLHTSAPYLYQWTSINASWRWIALSINTLARPAVPLFLICSGYLLLSKNDGILPFYRKRLMRILPPWIFWGGVSFILTGRGLSSIKAVFLNGFWFMPVIAGTFLLAPLFKKTLSFLSSKQVLLILFLWFLWMIGILAAKQSGYITHAHSFKFYILGYSGYFLFGGFLEHSKTVLQRKYQSLIYIIFGGSFLTTVLMTYLLSEQSGGFYGLWTFELLPNVMLLSVSSFWFLKENAHHFQKAKLIIDSISTASLGIFLSHVVILQFFEKLILWFDLPRIQIHPLIFIPVSTVVLFVLSWKLILLIDRLPLISWGNGVAKRVSNS